MNDYMIHPSHLQLKTLQDILNGSTSLFHGSLGDRPLPGLSHDENEPQDEAYEINRLKNTSLSALNNPSFPVLTAVKFRFFQRLSHSMRIAQG